MLLVSGDEQLRVTCLLSTMRLTHQLIEERPRHIWRLHTVQTGLRPSSSFTSVLIQRKIC